MCNSLYRQFLIKIIFLVIYLQNPSRAVLTNSSLTLFSLTPKLSHSIFFNFYYTNLISLNHARYDRHLHRNIIKGLMYKLLSITKSCNSRTICV